MHAHALKGHPHDKQTTEQTGKKSLIYETVKQLLNHATLHWCGYFTNRNLYLILNFSIMRSLCFCRFLRQLGNLLLQVALFAQELSRMLALSLGLCLAVGQLLGAGL